MNDNGGRWAGWLTFGVCLAVVLVLGGIFWFAPWGIDCLAGEPEQAKTCSETARNIGLSVAGGFGAIVAVIALHFNARRTHTDRLRLTNDTYVNAIEQLASPSMEVRIGGMYALERIAKDEQRYHWPVVETLFAYIRERAPWPARHAEPAKGMDAIAAAIATVGGQVVEHISAAQSVNKHEHATVSENGSDTTENDAENERHFRAPTDIQTALTIIGHRSQRLSRPRGPGVFRRQAPRVAKFLREWQMKRCVRSEILVHCVNAVIRRMENVSLSLKYKEPRSIDLSGTNLRHADLSKGVWARARFRNSDMTATDMRGAEFSGADFWKATLVMADLKCAVLRGADLRMAGLRGARLFRTDFRDADLRDQNLSGRNLFRCDFRDARLDDANFRNSGLRDTDFRGAMLAGTKFSEPPDKLGAKWDGPRAYTH